MNTSPHVYAALPCPAPPHFPMLPCPGDDNLPNPTCSCPHYPVLPAMPCPICCCLQCPFPAYIAANPKEYATPIGRPLTFQRILKQVECNEYCPGHADNSKLQVAHTYSDTDRHIQAKTQRHTYLPSPVDTTAHGEAPSRAHSPVQCIQVQLGSIQNGFRKGAGLQLLAPTYLQEGGSLER